jgi:hypothetical protein
MVINLMPNARGIKAEKGTLPALEVRRNQYRQKTMDKS